MASQKKGVSEFQFPAAARQSSAARTLKARLLQDEQDVVRHLAVIQLLCGRGISPRRDGQQ